MTAAMLIEKSRSVGIVLTLSGDTIVWQSDNPPEPELLAALRENRLSIIDALRMGTPPSSDSLDWLAQVAVILSTDASTLLEHGLVDLDDLAEQYRTHPRFAARLIESSPVWLRLNLGRGKTRELHAPEVLTNCVLTEVNKAGIPQIKHAPNWIAKRDAFYSHAVGHCKKCFPPASRYCPAGARLLALYQGALQ
ncbi:MAG: hypothetical protein COA41_20100 [Sphingopyxis sp.]|nr:MAG: hypothetical protein COA41_20100 [Sphingopyxis sp.]